MFLSTGWEKFNSDDSFCMVFFSRSVNLLKLSVPLPLFLSIFKISNSEKNSYSILYIFRILLKVPRASPPVALMLFPFSESIGGFFLSSQNALILIGFLSAFIFIALISVIKFSARRKDMKSS